MIFLKVYETFISVVSKYTDFVDVFSKNLLAELPEYTEINKHVIYLIEGYPSPYELIYNLKPVELEI